MPIPTIAILSAMPEELKRLLACAKIRFKKIYLNSPLWECTLYGQELVLRLMGIGKVNAALAAQHLINNFQISQIYNFGVAGSISKKVQIGDVVVADKVAQSDFNLTVFDYIRGQIPGFKDRYFISTVKKNKIRDLQDRKNGYSVHCGTIVSADQFIEDREAMVELGKEFGAIAKDMESAAIGQVCYLNNIPFTVVKGISDNSGVGAKLEYQNNLQRSVDNASEVLLRLLQDE